ncbi:uncharacterized protein LOC100898504 [Galendromus occidentalis]|uniref:Large ribosomal subunit protein bL21m n=1 Tax=Galendromus occidentalis TaxID=34638 RepID=A0AAJ6QST5_9ACAR|nr:uncharacterized protein LOC100898504 [Galendromus occidentalis]
MLRVLPSVARSLASSLSVRPLTSKAQAVTGEIVDQNRESRVIKTVLGAVNDQIEKGTHSRLFAVIYLHGKQFKVTAEDIIAVNTVMPVGIGETIRLNKILLAASTDFTLIGRPLLDQDLVRVYATVIERTLGHEYRIFKFRQRTRYQRSYFYRQNYTMLRINGIEIARPIDQ